MVNGINRLNLEVDLLWSKLYVRAVLSLESSNPLPSLRLQTHFPVWGFISCSDSNHCWAHALNYRVSCSSSSACLALKGHCTQSHTKHVPTPCRTSIITGIDLCGLYPWARWFYTFLSSSLKSPVYLWKRKSPAWVISHCQYCYSQWLLDALDHLRISIHITFTRSV